MSLPGWRVARFPLPGLSPKIENNLRELLSTRQLTKKILGEVLGKSYPD
jgi:hypothetical protein